MDDDDEEVDNASRQKEVMHDQQLLKNAVGSVDNL